MTATATVFMSGNSQAVRLPKSFRFDSKKVEIERRGDEVILREKKQTVGDILKRLASQGMQPVQDWALVDALIEDQKPQERDWSELLAGPDSPSSVTPVKTPRKASKSSL